MRIAKSFLRSQPFLGLLLALTLGVLAISPRVGTTLGVEAATLLVKSQRLPAPEHPNQTLAVEPEVGAAAPSTIEEANQPALGSSPLDETSPTGSEQQGQQAVPSETPVQASPPEMASSAAPGDHPTEAAQSGVSASGGYQPVISGQREDTSQAATPPPVSEQPGEALAAGGEDGSMDTQRLALAPSPSPLEARMLELLNARRAQQGLAPVVLNSQLLAVARARSEDMVSRNYFSHYTPEGDTVAKALMQTDLRGGFAELLGRNNSPDNEESVQQVAQAFDASPLHAAQIMQQRFVEVGIGVSIGAEGMRYYTVILRGP